MPDFVFVVRHNPICLKMLEAESQACACCRAALATIVEAAESRSSWVRAETDLALARLGVGLNSASLAASERDLEPFMQLLHEKASGGP